MCTGPDRYMLKSHYDKRACWPPISHGEFACRLRNGLVPPPRPILPAFAPPLRRVSTSRALQPPFLDLRHIRTQSFICHKYLHLAFRVPLGESVAIHKLANPLPAYRKWRGSCWQMAVCHPFLGSSSYNKLHIESN